MAGAYVFQSTACCARLERSVPTVSQSWLDLRMRPWDNHTAETLATTTSAQELHLYAQDTLAAVTFLTSKQYQVGAFTASPSMGAHTLPWILDYTHLVFWFFFLTSFILGVWLAQTFYLGVRGGEARFPIRETRGQSRAQTGDAITAIIPMSWSITMLMHANTHSSNFDENTSSAAFTCTVIAYQWGWNYYFPRDVVSSVWGDPDATVSGAPLTRTATLEERVHNTFLRQTGAPSAYGALPPLSTLSPSSVFSQPQEAGYGEGGDWAPGALSYNGEPAVRPLSAPWAPAAPLSAGLGAHTLSTTDEPLAPGELGGEDLAVLASGLTRTQPMDAGEGPARAASAAALALPRAALRLVSSSGPDFTLRGQAVEPGVAGLNVLFAPESLEPSEVALPTCGAFSDLTPASELAHRNAPGEPDAGASSALALAPSAVTKLMLTPFVAAAAELSTPTLVPQHEMLGDGAGAEALFAQAAPLITPLPLPLDDLDPVPAYSKWAPEVTTTRQSSPWAVDESTCRTPVRRMRVTSGVLLPSDVPIHLICGSKDVIHSWAIPGLGIKIDCIPGYNSHRRLLLRWRGLFWGQCMEVCGRYHHWMPILVRVVHVDVFCMWALAAFRLAEGAEGV